VIDLARGFLELGFEVYATSVTYKFLKER